MVARAGLVVFPVRLHSGSALEVVMTEMEWSTCSDPDAMVAVIRQRAEEGLLRLFGCRCCRRIWHLLADERSCRAVEVRELFEQDKASETELDEACRCADAARAKIRAPFRFGGGFNNKSPQLATAWAAGAALNGARGLYGVAALQAANAAGCASPKGWELGFAEERRAQCDLLREMLVYLRVEG